MRLGFRVRTTVLFSAAVLGALALACSGGASDSTSGTTAKGTSVKADTKIDVVLSEWAVQPSAASTKAGAVEFVAKNSGTQMHELVVVKTDLAFDKLPTAAGVVDETKVTVIDEIEPFEAGKTLSGTFSLAAGKYVLLCNVAAHYDLGMRAAFTVN